ncbi:MAG: hypothetical protein KKA60_04355 [Proteobacteria bacterium]|nr:hypothetical protein [Pseudomonadota bacterium]
MKAIRFKCPTCNVKIAVPAMMAGQLVECRSCGNPMLVPEQEEKVEAPQAPARALPENGDAPWWEDSPAPPGSPEPSRTGEPGTGEKPWWQQIPDIQEPDEEKPRVWRRRLKLLVLTVLLLVAAGMGGLQGWKYLNRPPELLWEKTLGGPGERSPLAASFLYGGIIALAGSAQLGLPQGQEAWVSLLDPDGGRIWDRFFGGNSLDEATALVPTEDGGITAVGRGQFRNPLGGDGFVWAVRLSPNGTVQWENRDGAFGGTAAQAALSGADGRLFMAGWDWERGTLLRKSRKRALALYLHPNGTLAWRVVLDIAGDSAATTVATAVDGGLVIAGVATDDAGAKALLLAKFKTWGELVWKKIVPVPGLLSVKAMTALPNGGFALAGSARGPEGHKTDLWAARTGEDGSLKWQKTFGGFGDDMAHALALTPDKDLVVVGETASSGAGQSDAYAIRLTLGGWRIWEKTWGGPGPDRATAVAAGPNGALVLTGTTTRNGSNPEAWVLRLGR